MSLRFFFTVFVGVFLLSFTAPASAAPPATIVTDANEHPLHPAFSVLPDTDARWNLDDFPRLRSEANELLHDGTKYKSIPYEMSRYWLIFDVTNPTQVEQWAIFIPMHMVDSLELVAVDSQGTRQFSRSGEDLSMYMRPFSDFGNSLPLTLLPNEQYQIAILVHDTRMPTLAINELSLMNIERYNQLSFRLSALIITSIATMIVMGLFMLLLFWRIKDPTYGWYALFALTTFFIWSTNYEFLRILFAPTRNLYLLNYLAMAAMLACSAQLTRSYLKLREHAPTVDRIYKYYNRSLLAWMCILIFVPFSLSYIMSAVFALIGLLILIAALSLTLRAGFRPVRLYLLAWVFYFASGGLTALDALGVELSTATIRLLTVTSTSVGLVIMAYSVVQRMEQLRSEKENAENRARKDILTGLFNRTAFEMDRKILQTAFKNKEIKDLFVVFIDLDGLKKLNDTQGHHHGDRLLILFAQYLEIIFHEYQHLYRLGGDEFMILLPDDTLAENTTWLHTRFTELLTQIQLAGFPNASCSYGVSSLTESQNSFKLAIRLADERMYAQKKSKKADKPAVNLPA